jgi:hypothetical protein
VRRREDRYKKKLRKMSKRGYRGHPLATIAYYGPDDTRASKVTVGIFEEEGDEPELFRYFAEDERDLRHDVAQNKSIVALLRQREVASLSMLELINGCPHEEGIDYPEGEDCPECPFWAGTIRPTQALRAMLEEE